MIDQTSIIVIAGTGGDGCISGRREKFVPYGGPDGGDGGDGGSVYLKCNAEFSTLISFGNNRRYSAGDGSRGKGKMKHGAAGQDLDISVPVGTEIRVAGKEGEPLADLSVVGERLMVAKGGNGGRGNTHFSTSTTRYPLLAEKGQGGEERKLTLTLKLLADVGIVGLPNVGKSSLISAITSAKPRVANYPFTTLEPTLGVAEHGTQSIVIVEVPGLIEGAHNGVGLGHEFLRHLERTSVLVHVLDGTEEDLVERYFQVRKEMKLYGHSLVRKPEIIVVNKMDVDGVKERYSEVRDKLANQASAMYAISAAGRTGLTDLLREMTTAVADAQKGKEIPSQESRYHVLRPKPIQERNLVKREGTKFVVLPGTATRLADMIDQDNSIALAQLYSHLKRLGIITALERAGISPGDVFQLGTLEMEWE